MPSTYFPDARLMRTITLPTSLNRIHHYINLTNGLEATPRLVEHIPPAQIGFVRWQSSHCEASRPDLLLQSLESSMLFQLARGHCVLVYDFGSRNKKRGAPRALWMGLEFVKWVLARVWYGKEPEAGGAGTVWVRGKNAAGEYEEVFRRLDSQTLKRLKYYRRFLEESPKEIPKEAPKGPDGVVGEPEIRLYGVYADTIHDHDDAYYVEMARWFDRVLLGEEGGEDVKARVEVSEVFREAVERGEPFDGRYAHDAMHPLEAVLGYRLFLGGINPVTYAQYMEGFKIVGGGDDFTE